MSRKEQPDDWNGGFSLVEVLVAMFLLSIMALFLDNLFLASIQINHISDDETHLTSIANDRMEQLKQMKFDDLGAPCLGSSNSCGSLEKDVSDTKGKLAVTYFDNNNQNYAVRWIISYPDPKNKNRKRVTVRSISKGLKISGNPRSLTLYFEKEKAL